MYQNSEGMAAWYVRARNVMQTADAWQFHMLLKCEASTNTDWNIPCRPGWHRKGLSIESVVENQKITNLWSQKFPNKNRWAFFRGRSCNRNPQSGHNLTSNDGRTTDDLPLPTWISVLLIRFISNLQMWLKAWKRWDPKWLCERKIYSGIILAFVQTTFFLKEGEPGLAKNGDPLSTSPFPVVVPFVASRLFWGTVPEYAKHTGWCVLNLDIYI